MSLGGLAAFKKVLFFPSAEECLFGFFLATLLLPFVMDDICLSLVTYHLCLLVGKWPPASTHLCVSICKGKPRSFNISDGFVAFFEVQSSSALVAFWHWDLVVHTHFISQDIYLWTWCNFVFYRA